MLKKKASLLIFYLFLCIHANAQFHGLNNFKEDTVLRKLLKSKRVKSVTETWKTDSTTTFNGRFSFNRSGMVTEQLMARGNKGFDRAKFYYNKNDEIIRLEVYDYRDTSLLDNWKIWTVDSLNRIIKEVKGYKLDGKAVEVQTYECTHFASGKGKREMLVKRHDPNLPADYTIIGRDSIAGIDTFFVTYETRTSKYQNTDKKELVRVYYKGDFVYKDEISYIRYWHTEVVKEIKTTYNRFKNKNLVEYGTLKYEDVYMDFMQEHPDDYSVNYYSPVFMKALIDRKIEAEKVPELKQVFDAKGLLIESSGTAYVYKFTYNNLKQLIKQEVKDEKNGNSVQLHTYNKNGLISKAIYTFIDLKGKKSVTECTYSYTYY